MATKTPDSLITALQKQIESLKLEPAQSKNVGTVIQAGDGVVEISGLTQAMYGEMVDFGNNIYGLVLNLLEDKVNAVVMGDFTSIKAGDQVSATGRILEVPVSNEMVGRVLNPLGQPIDGLQDIKAEKYYPIERIAPGIMSRKPVTVPMQTGIKAVDTLTPIGRGQRQLIIGDRGTGKSSVAITTILNQKDQDLMCVYIPIGQKKSFIAQTTEILRQAGALDYTLVVAASASDPVTYQYLAPYAGTAIAEYLMDQGKDVLVIYDDLSKHAWAYRELSLLMKRPAGREAYPGDVFYLHSRLLERSCRLNEAHGGGSITSLPIIETQAGDVSAYIPTNVISITDGQIYLEPSLFNSGIRPAINTGLSVSRVGSAAQRKTTKQVAGSMKLELAQYRELQAFSQFASDLDPETKARLDRGARITQLLKQGWDEPYSVAQQVAVIWAVNEGYLKRVDVEDVKEWEAKYLDYLGLKAPKLLDAINQTKDKMSDKEIKELHKHTQKFNETTGRSLLTLEQKEKS